MSALFFTKNEGSVNCSLSAGIQHVSTLEIDIRLITNDKEKINSLDEEIYPENDQDVNFVGIAKAKKGKFLVSDSFGPCQALVARLKTGECVLYHVLNYKSNAMQDFLNEIGNSEIEDIIIFQKEKNKKNKTKAPLLAIELAEKLHERGINADIKRIHMDNYTSIVVDSVNNVIVLADNIKYTKNESKIEPDSISEDNKLTTLDINNSIDIDQSVRDVRKLKAETGYNYSIPKFLNDRVPGFNESKGPSLKETKEKTTKETSSIDLLKSIQTLCDIQNKYFTKKIAMYEKKLSNNLSSNKKMMYENQKQKYQNKKLAIESISSIIVGNQSPNEKIDSIRVKYKECRNMFSGLKNEEGKNLRNKMKNFFKLVKNVLTLGYASKLSKGSFSFWKSRAQILDEKILLKESKDNRMKK